jgi:hypothetical protein
MSQGSLFRLPKDGAIYAASIFSRCRDLIAYQVWSGIQPHRLDQWIGNFDGEIEQYFAARVLDVTIYRSNLQTVALMKQLFGRVIPDLARSNGLPAALRTIDANLKNPTVDPRVRIVPVIPPGDSPTKSGASIARMLKRHLRFSESWIIQPTDIGIHFGSTDTFIFVDDFLGTGIQFSQFLSRTGIDQRLSKAIFVYAPLAAHVDGITHLHNSYPTLHVGAVEGLDDSHALFHAQAGSFPDAANSAEIARDFYYDLLRRKKIDIDGPDRRGFGHFELTYAFEHAIPDNSLPILWWNMSNDWKPLFDR